MEIIKPYKAGVCKTEHSTDTYENQNSSLPGNSEG